MGTYQIPDGHKAFGELEPHQQIYLRNMHVAGHPFQFWNKFFGEWRDCEPQWVENIAYRVKPEEQMHKIDGLVKLEWIKAYRNKTGAYLKDSLDKWNELEAAGITSTAEAPGVCTVIEADIANNRLVIQMLSNDYSVAPGKYKLVRL